MNSVEDDDSLSLTDSFGDDDSLSSTDSFGDDDNEDEDGDIEIEDGYEYDGFEYDGQHYPPSVGNPTVAHSDTEHEPNASTEELYQQCLAEIDTTMMKDGISCKKPLSMDNSIRAQKIILQLFPE